MAKAKRKTQSKPPITADEKNLIRARKLVGHDHLIRKDEFGRDRVVKTADKRQFDIGTMKTVVRVRNVDPLAGISSLTWQQRSAGLKFREDYETCQREGLKTGSWEMSVDGGDGDRDRSRHITDAHKRLARDYTVLGYREMRRVVEYICGLGMSLKEMSAMDRNPREVNSVLLGMGLQKIAVARGIVTEPK